MSYRIKDMRLVGSRIMITFENGHTLSLSVWEPVKDEDGNYFAIGEAVTVYSRKELVDRNQTVTG